MFTFLKVKNFQSLVDLEVNLMKTKTKPKKLVIVYGENGVGKTNFVKIFHMLRLSTRTMSVKDIIRKVKLDNFNNDEKENFFEFIKTHYCDTEDIIKQFKTIDSYENMSLEFEFIIKNKKGRYYIEYNNNEIVSESLDFVLNSNQTNLYTVINGNIKINENIFKDKEYKNYFKKQLLSYWGKHSFLSILNNETEEKTKNFISKNIDKSIVNILYFLKFLNISVSENYMDFGSYKQLYKIDNLLTGEISKSDESALNKIENVLSTIFTSLYSDIKNVFYEKKYLNDKISYRLCLKKLIYGNLINIDFKIESTGTINILRIIPYILLAAQGEVVIIDEFDTGIHDVLVEKLIINIKDYLKGQLIITTHNTILLESELKKEDIYLFNVNYNAEKKLISLTEFGERNHKNFNMRKRYISGLYNGIPFVSEIDFDELVFSLREK